MRHYLASAYILAVAFGGAAAADAPKPLAQQQQPASNNLRKAVGHAFDRDTFDAEYDAAFNAAQDHQDVLDAIDLVGEPEATFPAPTCNVGGSVGFVNCTAADNCYDKCEAACSGVENCSCCDNGLGGADPNACANFVGQVCPDNSCSGGNNACYYAEIDYVVRSCQGVSACFFAGDDYPIPQVVDSCVGERACVEMAYSGGTIESIFSSCRGFKACYQVVKYSGGSIPSMSFSCNAFRACYQAGYDSVIDVPFDFCCNTDNACEFITNSTDLNCDTYAPSPTPSISDKPSQSLTPTLASSSLPSYKPSSTPSTSIKPSVTSSDKPSPINSNVPSASMAPSSSSMPTCEIQTPDVVCEPGVCFHPATPAECPRGEYLGLEYLFKVREKCDHRVPMGKLCESDGGCGTSNELDNCAFLDFRGHPIAMDVYKRVNCCGADEE